MSIIQLPDNKSYLIRVLALQALKNKQLLIPINQAKDVEIMYAGLQAKNSFDFKDAGTPCRFLLAYYCLNHIPIRLTGSNRLNERPLKPLLSCLESLGAEFNYLKKPYSLPLIITKGINPFEKVTINGDESSQFVSAIALLACSQTNKVIIDYAILSSKAYLNQTLTIIKQWGFKVFYTSTKITLQAPTVLTPTVKIEKDFSSFLFLLNLSSILLNHKFIAKNLHLGTQQADEKVLLIYSKIGFIFNDTNLGLAYYFRPISIKKITLNIGKYLDAFPALVTIAQKLNIKLYFTNWENLEKKESNRITAMQKNLNPFGAQFKFNTKELVFIPGNLKPSKLNVFSFNDHRIVMAMSLFSISTETTFDNVSCVAKSFPNFWEEFEKIKLLANQ